MIIQLKVSVKAWKADDNVLETEVFFTALEASLSEGMVDIGFCKLEIIVAWSLISQYPVLAGSVKVFCEASDGDNNVVKGNRMSGCQEWRVMVAEEL
uniref:Uncharacterized protein n=1 Tax=Oryza barthii TaxID=65489 RepID=A0A0D3GW82_9ORYZ